MNLRKFFQKTWTTGLLIFSMLALRKNKKTIEVREVSSEEKTNEEGLSEDKN